MESYDKNTTGNTSGQEPEKLKNNNWSGRPLAGVIIVTIGAVFLADRMGADIPHWIYSLPTLLIGIGLYVGARHSFRGIGWLIPIIIGSVLLLDDLVLDFSLRQLMWPIFIICAGLYMIFKPKRTRRHDWRRWDTNFNNPNTENTSEDHIDSTIIFGSVKKNIISKDFKGGESVCVFGGTELNLSQADINGRVVIEIVQLFGGTKLIVPSNWQIQSDEMVSIFGGLEDKRPVHASINVDQNKVLILKGTCLFGGIDIKSY